MDTVIEGQEGFLFLSAGAHAPLLYARGQKHISQASLRVFWNNQKWRRAALKKRNIRHVHLIAPDKHNVCPEVFPEEIVVHVGAAFLQAAPEPELAAQVIYPQAELASDFRRYCSRVDTHYTPFGSGILCLSVLRALGEVEAASQLEQHLSQPGTVLDTWAGDLGRRFDPPRTEARIIFRIKGKIEKFSNSLNHNLKGNNGMLELYVNHSPAGKPLGRVMLFGDSFGMLIAPILAHFAQEIMVLRTPYMHLDLIDSAKPDIVITENVERYLPSTLSDAERPNFFLFPFFKDDTNVMILRPSAIALSDFLSGRPFLLAPPH